MCVHIYVSGPQAAADLDTPKALAAVADLSLWFKAHIPDLLDVHSAGMCTMSYLVILGASYHLRSSSCLVCPLLRPPSPPFCWSCPTEPLLAKTVVERPARVMKVA